jgi:hypothetical protein
LDVLLIGVFAVVLLCYVHRSRRTIWWDDDAILEVADAVNDFNVVFPFFFVVCFVVQCFGIILIVTFNSYDRLEHGGSFIFGFRPSQVVFICVEGNLSSCYTVVCLTLRFLGFRIDAFATVPSLVAVDATVAAFALVRRGRSLGGLTFLVDGAKGGLGLGGWSLLCVCSSSFASVSSRAFAFASTSTSFSFGWRTATFAFAALISSLSFVALKGDGVIRQGRVLVAQSAELEMRVLREAGKCI